MLDLSTYVAGPSATMTLAQLGADVVRIDPIGGAPDVRRLPLAPDGSSLYWAGLNKGKRSVEVDLRGEAGRDVVRSLLRAGGEGHGILLTNAVGQPWLDYQQLRTHRPDLIMVHIGGQPDGKPAVDYTVNCEVGLPWLTGPADSTAPVNHVLPAWDLLTGLHAALSVLVADRARRHTGEGQFIRINLAEVALATMGHLGFVADVAVNGGGRRRDGNHLYGSYGCDFATADGRRVMVVALTSRHWQSLIELTGRREVVAALAEAMGVDFGREETRYQHREVITALLAPWFAERNHRDVVAALDRGQVLWGDYRTVAELVDAPDGLLARSGLFTQVRQSGAGTFPVPRPVSRAEGWGDDTTLLAPAVGADTDVVLQQWLGHDLDTVRALRASGIVGGR
ncbi:2-methylfumaryl-CoA isomerase [Micromonospora zingiberis]|uniref:2-methylfumaryl-CoA isomerase n=1 Tax=Micromonospora zingiberis TaxID=2053011 RepID=A0A4R0GNV5_9ACTN|nr:2-methylfumaryl-CoA isomerase [Micromonospora zingiberis]